MTESKTKQAFKTLCAMSLAVGIGGAALTALPTDADATIFSGSFVVNAHTSEPGLVINTFALGGGLFSTPDLIEGQSKEIDLFEIWTNESNVNGNNQHAKQISVEFTFTAPTPPFSGIIEGNTGGLKIWGLVQSGYVAWDGPLTLPYPGGGDGELKITLSDEYFNTGGLFGLDKGYGHGATVKATFRNKADPTPAPEPATLAILGLGLAGLGWAARRRKQEV